MSPKLALLALAGALSLSGCYYVPYGYYPSYPPPLNGAYQTQPGVAGAPVGASGAMASSYQQPAQQYDPNAANGQQQYAAPAQQPAVAYAPYPAYYPGYPVYAPYPGYYGYGYGGYPAYGYAPSVSIGLGFGWGGGYGGYRGGGYGGYHGGGYGGGGHGWHGH